LLGIVAVPLLIGGAQLLRLGGSAYYVLVGLLVAASAILTWRRNPFGAWLYGLMLVLTLAWAIWESGFYGWALAPRLIAPFVLGLGFLMPSARGVGDIASFPVWARGWRGLGAGLIGGLVIGAAAFAIGPGYPADPALAGGLQSVIPAAQAVVTEGVAGDWLNYGNDPGGTRYSPLTQLTPANVGRLKLAWQVDLGPGPGGKMTQLEVTPIKVGSSLYICTAYNDVVSIDAETGHVNWRFRSGNPLKSALAAACRGVAYFKVPGATGACAERIITNTTDARLIALDAATGAPCQGFGTNGTASLTDHMGDVTPGYYYVSSAPTIVHGKIILGGWVVDGQYWGEASGVIRAFDALTGKFAWAFDMGRPDDHGQPAPGKTFTLATPNSWAPMSADEKLGLVYAPTGNATPDYYGAQRRPFDDRYSSSIVAIDADTGAVRWSFQTTHHDIWDYDVASQPTLVDIDGANGVQHALLAPTKRGELFMLDRVTGKPIATVEEKPVPQRGVAPGERLSATQPFSTGLPSFRGPLLTEAAMWGLTPIDQMWCRIKFREARYDGPLTPTGLTPNIIYPGYLGGMDWGGVSIDRARGIAIVVSNRVPNYDRLLTRAAANARKLLPMEHGGSDNIAGASAQARTPYAADVGPFLSPLGAPCNQPPYGMVSAIDLRTHKLLWTRPIGTSRDSGPLGVPSMLPIPMGVPLSGGTIATASDLIFMGATQERMIRALDATTGEELWRARLPAGGHATPMTYLSPASGRQFVVIAAGGNFALQSKLGANILAYAIPR
jgi:quinoprotein glucose dehydrogenase